MSDTFRKKNKYHRFFCFFKGSPYCYAEGSSQLRACLHDAIINSAPQIGDSFYKNE